MSATCQPPLRSRPYVGPGNNDVQAFKLFVPTGTFFVDQRVDLAQPADTLFYSSFVGGFLPSQLAFSFQPYGIRLFAGGGNPPSGGLISFSQGVMWRFRTQFKTFYLTGAQAGASGMLVVLAINGMKFHSESS